MSQDTILSEAQIGEYRTNGYVFVPQMIARDEISKVMSSVAILCSQSRREVILEADGKTVRSLMNPHRIDDVLSCFVRHPKLIRAVRQIVEDDVYIFQSIINMKWPFTGDVWPWHQDFPTYFEDDGMKEPRAVNVLVFLEDVSEFNGPLMLIPGTHEEQAHITTLDTTSTSYPGRWITSDLVDVYAKANGIVAPKGPAGSVIFAHTNIVHGSGPNMSPWGRTMLSLTLNSIANRHQGSRRPDWVVLNDYTPVVPLERDRPVPA